MKLFLTVFFLLAAISIPFSFGEEVPELFTELESQTSLSSLDTNSVLNYNIAKQASNQLQANLNAFDSDKLGLKLFDQEFVVEKQHVVYRTENDFSWFGKITNSDFGIVTIVVKNNGISGHIQTMNSTYMITQLANDNHIIQELDLSLLPDEAEPDSNETDLLGLQSSFTPTSSHTNSNQIITVYAVYTTDAENSTNDIERDIQLAIDNANTSYLVSDIGITLELLSTDVTTFVEGSTFDDSQALMDPNDGNMDEIHAERDRLAADVVILFEENFELFGNSFCGIVADKINATQLHFVNVSVAADAVQII